MSKAENNYEQNEMGVWELDCRMRHGDLPLSPMSVYRHQAPPLLRECLLQGSAQGILPVCLVLWKLWFNKIYACVFLFGRIFACIHSYMFVLGALLCIQTLLSVNILVLFCGLLRRRTKELKLLRCMKKACRSMGRKVLRPTINWRCYQGSI